MSEKKKLIVVAVLLALVLLTGVLMSVTRNNKTELANRADTNNTQDDKDEVAEESKTDQPASTPAPGQDKEANNPAPQPQPAAPKISITGKQQIGQVVQVRAVVNNLTAGVCSATFTGPQGTQPFVRESQIIDKGGFYGCKDIDIPVADFSKSGTWHMAIFAANLNNKSNIAEADILVTK